MKRRSVPLTERKKQVCACSSVHLSCINQSMRRSHQLINHSTKNVREVYNPFTQRLELSVRACQALDSFMLVMKPGVFAFSIYCSIFSQYDSCRAATNAFLQSVRREMRNVVNQKRTKEDERRWWTKKKKEERQWEIAANQKRRGKIEN